ncbi:hypothetical protein MHH49_17945 [Paenibacillus sp. FSL F4-0122]|uniref:hypothetical protein n=1 Tax=Paenibacillus sp. FSL F4-0122 TaxID=2921371 RepID=UPI0030F5B97B
MINFWDPQSNEYGVKAPEDERDRRLREIIGLDSWIAESVYRSWVEPSFAAADKIVVLITPLSVQEEPIWKKMKSVLPVTAQTRSARHSKASTTC